LCFELPILCNQVSQPMYKCVQMWQTLLNEWYTISLPISVIISYYTCVSPNSIWPHNDQWTGPARLMQSGTLVYQDSDGWSWPIRVWTQKWLMK
jgi:hypothetical protein